MLDKMAKMCYSERTIIENGDHDPNKENGLLDITLTCLVPKEAEVTLWDMKGNMLDLFYRDELHGGEYTYGTRVTGPGTYFLLRDGATFTQVHDGLLIMDRVDVTESGAVSMRTVLTCSPGEMNESDSEAVLFGAIAFGLPRLLISFLRSSLIRLDSLEFQLPTRDSVQANDASGIRNIAE
ncbi:MAG: hypothetical protein RLZZ324_468 [Candidatus Parcubacteria bacterium]|jgi:hypothetical protein